MGRRRQTAGAAMRLLGAMRGAPDAGDERIARERAAGEGCQQQERQPPLRRERWQAHGRHRRTRGGLRRPGAEHRHPGRE
eukprot:COSAG06_NODE_914_length_11578_cov_31.792926_4_plen_80_part_00